LKVHSVDYNTVADNTSLSSFVQLLVAPKSTTSREIQKEFELTAD